MSTLEAVGLITVLEVADVVEVAASIRLRARYSVTGCQTGARLHLTQ